ncbi:PREDICTED: 39S ribosomal protein L44, mitochondrial [Bactrocera latifrons]|uniref:Large ribosomal subunit protein mL44 n=1 Tax=Bactrocera latifrons TaxID=174628 RepID=A0A0K8UE72_BACLA|nr:PREDICTED: 39S ribosomal protein L44, mitochondrial [Bactrocera latifrons]
MSLFRLSLRILNQNKGLTRLPVLDQTRCFKRWVAPTLRELRRRQKKLGPQLPQPRSGFIEWNYRAELFAFGKRLHEEFDLEMLQAAFTQPSYVQKEQVRQRDLGVVETDVVIKDNYELSERGAYLANECVRAYLRHSFPNVPVVGINAFTDYLLSTGMLSHIATHLGMTELLLDDNYPPEQESLARSLLAVIGTIEQCSGQEQAFLFIRDFVCTQMNQRDLLEIWSIDDPELMLKQICEERNLGEIEPRLIGDCGKNTLLAAYHVGLYANKKLIGRGFGEDVATATKVASLNALQEIFGIQDNMRPLNFQAHLKPEVRNAIA